MQALRDAQDEHPHAAILSASQIPHPLAPNPHLSTHACAPPKAQPAPLLLHRPLHLPPQPQDGGNKVCLPGLGRHARSARWPLGRLQLLQRLVHLMRHSAAHSVYKVCTLHACLRTCVPGWANAGWRTNWQCKPLPDSAGRAAQLYLPAHLLPALPDVLGGLKALVVEGALQLLVQLLQDECVWGWVGAHLT